jgi:hypothetical protein
MSIYEKEVLLKISSDIKQFILLPRPVKRNTRFAIEAFEANPDVYHFLPGAKDKYISEHILEKIKTSPSSIRQTPSDIMNNPVFLGTALRTPEVFREMLHMGGEFKISHEFLLFADKQYGHLIQ